MARFRRISQGRKKKQDKTLALQAPPGQSLLPAVRAVSGVRKLASLTGGKRDVGVSFPTKPRVAGFLPMSVWMKVQWYEVKRVMQEKI